MRCSWERRHPCLPERVSANIVSVLTHAGRQGCLRSRRCALEFYCRRAAFAACAWSWNNLAGIAESSWIKCGTHAQHRVHIICAEDERKIVALIKPDAVLARDRAARAHARLHQLAPGLFNAQDFFRVARVEAEERM